MSEALVQAREIDLSGLEVFCGSCAEQPAKWHMLCPGCSGVDLCCSECQMYFDGKDKLVGGSACLSCGHWMSYPIPWQLI